MRFLQHRIAGKRLLRLIKQTLKAGTVEDSRYSKTVVGTPQGAVISLLLANIYLYYVLDLWANQWRKRNVRGECYIVRYADGGVLGLQYRSDGLHFMAVLKDLLGKFGLSLNAEKTRLLEFGRFEIGNRKARKQGKPDTSWSAISRMSGLSVLLMMRWYTVTQNRKTGADRESGKSISKDMDVTYVNENI